MRRDPVCVECGLVISRGAATEIVESAVEAERHGRDSVITWNGMSVGSMGTFDPWTLLGAMALTTERVTLGIAGLAEGMRATAGCPA